MRRARLRSTNGCNNCRRRRVKCDESGLRCLACQRLKLECSLAAVEGGKGVEALHVPAKAVLLETDGSLTFSDAQRAIYFGTSRPLSPEAVMVIEHYTCHENKFLGEPHVARARSFLDFLPIAGLNEGLFASLMTHLSSLMPDDWLPRKQCTLQFGTSALACLSKAVKPMEDKGVANETLASVGLLYLTSLYDHTGKLYKRTHLLGHGALLRQHALQSASQGIQVSASRIESYLYHMVLSSTVDFGLVHAGTQLDYVEDAMDYMATMKGLDRAIVDAFGVPVCELSCIFHGAYLRNELMNHQIHRETMETVSNDLTKGALSSCEPREAVRDTQAVMALYRAASQAYCRFMLRAAIRQLPAGSISSSGIVSDITAVEDAVIDDAIASLSHYDDPHHRLSWALFIIGLTRYDAAGQEAIKGILEKMVSNQRVRSVGAVLLVLRTSWEAKWGLDVLLDSQAVAEIMF